MPVEDDTTDLTSSSKKTHRLSYNGHQDHHIAALQTLARSGSISLTGPLVAEPEDSESSRESSSASLAELYKYERPGDKKSLRRIHAMTELLDTERTYVHDLRVLVEGCFDRLNAASWLTSENRFLLMRNANDLYKFQQEFLAALEEAMSGFDASPDNDLVPVAKVFLEMREKFQVYKGYCTQHDGAVRILTEYEKRPEMISFLQDFKGRAQTRLDLKDYLIKPVQRVCRYPLLLHELIKNTEEESNDYQDLLGAYSEMQSLAVEIDAAKSMIEKLERTDRFFARLENTLQIDIPKRTECGEMVFGGGLFIVNHDLFAPKIKYRGIFVFGNAYLMVVKPKRATVYNLKLCIPLSAYEFRYLGSRECPLPFAFRLRHAEGSQYYDFGTQSDKERAAWGEVLVQLTRPPTGTRSRHQSPSVEPAPLAGVSPTAPKRTGSAGSLSSLNTLSTMASIDESALAAAIASERELQHQQSGRRKFWRQSSVEVDRSGSGMGGPYVFARRPSVDYKMFDVVTFFPDSRESWGPSARTARSAHDLKDCSPSSGQFPELQSASSMPGLADRSSINDPRRSRLIGPPLVVLRQISEPSFHNGPLQRSPEQHHHHSYSADAASGDLDDSRQTILHGPPLRNTRSVISFRTMNMLFSSSAPTSPGPMGATSPPGTSTTNTNTGPPVPVRTSFSSFRGPGSHMLNRYPSRSSSRSMASWTSDSSVGAATVEEDEEEGSAEGGKEGKGKGSGGAKRVYKTWSQIFSKGSKKLGFKKGGKMAGAGAGAGGGSAGGAGGGGPPAGEGAGKLR
ncbi:Phosphatidylinositol 3,4,5-trisphosphate-dependent Rac exchanger 2 protein [Borealophlyctis nickersoniae]|nr:Phosphatidylinositol 3,4,5-trisphosphate-dependent Rac exchanger 2 protein [Borealophlyctis nickersoniae]